MGPATYKDTGALDPEQHAHLYTERPEDVDVRETLKRVGTECAMISLIGARQTGKTSLLNRLHREYNDANGWAAIQIDMTPFASFAGVKWYIQCIAKCCERLQKRGIAVTMEAVRQECERKYIDPVWSPQGCAEMLRLACLSLPPGHRLLVALDEISRVPSTEWDVLFGNIRAVHQAASSVDDPEYRRLGMVLAGAFVPAHLIRNVEQSPFNVGEKIYMSLATVDQVRRMLQPLIASGITIEPAAVDAIYHWTGGLLYHVQRFCEMLEQRRDTQVSAGNINTLANTILFDDAYLTRVRSRLEGNDALLKWAAKILKQPIKSDRSNEIIAHLEMIGVIHHEPATNQWVIVNRLCESFLEQYFSEKEGAKPALRSSQSGPDHQKYAKKEESLHDLAVGLKLQDQGSTSMPGLSPALLKKLKATLLDCGPFGNDPMVLTVFQDERIKPWKNDVSAAAKPKERVDLFVSDFLDRKNRAGQSVLVLFLQAVYDQAQEEDECHQRLNDIAIEVAAAISTELPPLARHNLWRASAAQAGEALLPNLGGYALPAETDLSAQVAPLPSGVPAKVFAEQLESLKNKEKADWLPVGFLEKGLQAARAVGRVEYRDRQIGTAFLVAPDIVLTNAHVVRDIPVLTEGGVRFNIGLQAEAQWRYFAGLIVQSPSEELDFALVRLNDAMAGVAPVTFSTEAAYPAQLANILQYPGKVGGLMQVALRYNAIVHVDPTRLYYATDTDGGSSGSPVFNDDWRVIALHRAGIVDDAQRPVKNANQGVPLTAIAPLIRPYLAGG